MARSWRRIPRKWGICKGLQPLLVRRQTFVYYETLHNSLFRRGFISLAGR